MSDTPDISTELVEAAPDAIVAVDTDGRIVLANHQTETLFGYAKDERIGQTIEILVPEAAPPNHIAHDRLAEERDLFSQATRGERVPEFETVRVCGDGSPVHVACTMAPLHDATGAVTGVSSIARDISERKRTENERHGFEERLERS